MKAFGSCGTRRREHTSLNDQKNPATSTGGLPPAVIPGNPAPLYRDKQPAIVSDTTRRPFSEGSGRLELAKTSPVPSNPLTSRVMVIACGPGTSALASSGRRRFRYPLRPAEPSGTARFPGDRFMRDGWSLKKLHKFIMLSATYQQSSQVDPETFKLDPENKLLAHQNRRRLDFEAMRESVLRVVGRLDTTMGGKPVDLFRSPFQHAAEVSMASSIEPISPAPCGPSMWPARTNMLRNGSRRQSPNRHCS